MKLKKIENSSEKEKIRNGTKNLNKSVEILKNKGVNKFLNKIIMGKSENILRKIPDSTIDMIITSPPYNFGHKYAGDQKEDTLEWNSFFSKLMIIWEECYRILKPGGRIAVNVQPLFSDYIPTHHIISKQLLNLGFLWKSEIIWEKNNYNAKYTAWGSWKSPSMPYLKYTWEYIEIFDKETHKKIGNKEMIDITGEEFKKWVYAKWSFSPERNMKNFNHPAMFPEELPKRLIKLFSYKGDIILDPFNGVGTTSLVAYKLNRRFIGIDSSKEYCETAFNRINNASNQGELFVQNKGLEFPLPKLKLKI